MRRPAVFVVLLAAAALVAVLVAGRSGNAGTESGRALLLGDSLNVGIEPWLPDALPGWTIVSASRVGMATYEGVGVLARTDDRQTSHVIVSLGTNDSPDGVAGFRTEVRRVLQAIGPGRCVVWATVWRGEANPAFDAVLRDAGAARSRIRIVDWSEMVTEHPDWLAPDGVHATDEGYRERARAIAAAARSCAPEREVRAP
jgi:hypothetical protein